MRDLFFTELRNKAEEINAMDASAKETGDRELQLSVKRIIELSNIARNEGLLALEEAAYENITAPYSSYLSTLILYIVDGTDPELVEDVALTKYFSNALKGYEGLIYLIYLNGSLAIQQGENPRLIEEKLLAMLPCHVEEQYRKQREEEEPPVAHNASDKSFVENLCHSSLAVQPGEEFYFIIKLTDYALTSLTDHSLQRLLREVDNVELTTAMIGLSGEARKHIFRNLSERIAVLLAQEMHCAGATRIRTIAEMCQKIMTILIKLMEFGEIACKEEEALSLFYHILSDAAPAEKAKDTRQKEHELEQLFREYRSTSNRYINV